MEIAGLKSIAYSSADVTEVNGAKGRTRVYGVQAMENSDKVYVRSQATGTLTEGGKSHHLGGDVVLHKWHRQVQRNKRQRHL